LSRAGGSSEGAASLAEPLNDVDFGRFDSEAIRSHAKRFSAAYFRDRFRKIVDGYRDLA
jgi:hypothetical protein